MTNAYVLMTAMPPTKGHLHLIQFAASLSPHAHVIVCTQPDEPYWQERLLALQKATRGLENVVLHHIHKELPQEPEQHPGFWDMWVDFLKMFGFQEGDYVVASETYGVKLAEEAGGQFMPYDISRSVYQSKATEVRNDPWTYFDQILPEFQPCLRKRVTIFGAESVGKTTLSHQLANRINGHWLPEWARPYLETVGSEITTQKMEAIWHGQNALQKQGTMLLDKPFIVQDTDLFSTVGYWDMWDMGTPTGLVDDAILQKSDLYLIPPSNVPFVADPLRYGGDKRESTDSYWIGICEKYGLRYKVIPYQEWDSRLAFATRKSVEYFYKYSDLYYERITKETLKLSG